MGEEIKEKLEVRCKGGFGQNKITQKINLDF